MLIPIPFYGWFEILEDNPMTTFITEDREKAQMDYDYADAFLRMKTLMKKYHQLMMQEKFHDAFTISTIIKDTADELEVITQNFTINPRGY
jgi:hypothetical protein